MFRQRQRLVPLSQVLGSGHLTLTPDPSTFVFHTNSEFARGFLFCIFDILLETSNPYSLGRVNKNEIYSRTI